MNEKNLPAALPAKSAGSTGKEIAGAGAPGAAPGLAGAPAAPVAKPASLFGGHVGGGKRRADGLLAGSDEAKAADRAKDAIRQKENRARKAGAVAPPPLPSVVAPAPGAVPAQAVGQPPLPGPVAAVAGPAPLAPAPGPAFVRWSAGLLTKPARLVVRIIDRLRMGSLTKRVAKLNLTREAQTTVMDGFKWQASAVEDFSNSLAMALEIELNKRNVAGAENSHLLNVAISGGELVLAHVQALQTLEKMILESQGATAQTEKRA